MERVIIEISWLCVYLKIISCLLCCLFTRGQGRRTTANVFAFDVPMTCVHLRERNASYFRTYSLDFSHPSVNLLRVHGAV